MALSVRSKRKGRRLRPEAERKTAIPVAAEPVQKRLGIIRPTRSKELPASGLGNQESSGISIVWVIVSLALLFILTITWLIWLGYGGTQ